MTYDPPRPVGRLLLTPEDRDAPERVRRLRSLGLGEYAEPAFDAFADRLAEVASVPYAMVNFIDEHRQFFAGLHVSARPTADTTVLGVDRRLARDHGFCPYVVVRRKGLVLDDVAEYPRFAGNPVVDDHGIRSYLGAPLLDRTGIALGTVCVLDVRPRPWGRAGLETIKSMAAELAARIEGREAFP
ncbi:MULTISPECIES: GAF domain-containing protein [Streptomyces]|uniref:GAF domain-containing protein n=1 Tax=Streptomyces stelliscabiei TaxID=146820 RepID=A0A8I0PHS7_9ACTN|nr:MULTISPECIES: GAF domain-containing protein [Streptomyces]KND44585.1 histidine kinase [Streptomyces stelliscabiei]MBE1601758.1 GAF domain-containing protein [Streptomyces stelliscabiei]MDX2514934.1 GAF domain-containing protein [Streptomyces stelliscabiei]MDX2555374.1 GAF domain-containing protein [Streptomyces stelliscabiei]MDX2617378.1 GAF domain-containing protein [Streptomyces stelliscabiei]